MPGLPYGIVYSPGALMDAVRSFFLPIDTYFGFPGFAFSSSVLTSRGFRAVYLLVTYEGDPTVERTIVLGTLEATATAPLDYFLRSPGWDGCMGMYFSPSEFPGYEWPVLTTLWRDLIVDLKKSIIDTWSSGSWVSEDWSEASGIDASIRSLTVSQLLTSPLVVYASPETLQGTDLDTTDTGWDSRSAPAPYGVSGNPAITLSVGALTKAVEDLGAVDTTIALNQGAALYSVGNREITS